MRVEGFDELPNGDQQLHTYDVSVELILMLLLDKLGLELNIDKKGKPVLEKKS